MRPLAHTVAVTALTLFTLTSAAGAEPSATSWPQFRGPARDGVSKETGLRTSWPADGPRLLWRKPLGQGYSGIAVVDGRVFTMYADAEDELVVALDAASGRELWRYRLDAKYYDGQGNGPRATPTVDGDRVYALGARGRLAALEAASGQELWSHDLQRLLGARPPTWGVSSSPLVEGDLLLLDVGGRAGASVAALDKGRGEVVWTSQSDKAGYSAPLAITVAGARQVVFFTGTQLVSVSPEDGGLLWRIPWKTSYDVNAATPIFVPPNKLFVSSGYHTGSALLRLGVAGGRATVEEVWRSRGMKNQFSSSVLHGGSIYGFDNNFLKAIDVRTGEEQWAARGFGHGSLIYADGHLLVLGDRGRLSLVEASPEEFREKASAQVLEGKCWTAPALAGGRLFLRNEKEIVALEVAG